MRRLNNNKIYNNKKKMKIMNGNNITSEQLRFRMTDIRK
jgi:hypothetical protein